MPSVKQQFAAARTLFDWPVVGQIMLTNPAAAGSKAWFKTGTIRTVSGHNGDELSDQAIG